MAEKSALVAQNRKARHEYEILETFEAGLVLMGPEVKSMREGNVNLQDGYATIEGGEAWLHGVHISPYDPADRWNTDPRRRRKLLLNKTDTPEGEENAPFWRTLHPDAIAISAKTGKGLDRLQEAVYNHVRGTQVEVALEADITNGRLISFIESRRLGLSDGPE